MKAKNEEPLTPLILEDVVNSMNFLEAALTAAEEGTKHRTRQAIRNARFALRAAEIKLGRK